MGSRLDADLGMLVRIALLHWGELPKLGFVEDDGAFLVRCRLNGVRTAGFGTRYEEAAAEAVGNAISVLQTGRVPTGEKRTRARLAAIGPATSRPLPDAFPGGIRIFGP